MTARSCYTLSSGAASSRSHRSHTRVPFSASSRQPYRSPDVTRCEAPGEKGAKGKKKKAKKKRNQFGELVADEEDDDGPSYKIH